MIVHHFSKKIVALLFVFTLLVGCSTRDKEQAKAVEQKYAEQKASQQSEPTSPNEEEPNTPDPLGEKEQADLSPENSPLPQNEEAPTGEAITQQPTIPQAAAHNATLSDSDVTLLQLEMPKKGDALAIVDTSSGGIVFRLFPEEAPLAVENFIALADAGYYENMSFQRIMENFYIESGAPEDAPPTSSFTDSEGNPVPFVTETSVNLWNFRGALVMKNKGVDRPHTNTSEFRIIQASLLEEEWFEQMEEINYPQKVIDVYKEQGGIPGFDSRCTVFGQVVEGMNVVDRIATAPVEEDSYRPAQPTVIYDITIATHDGRTTSYLPETIEVEGEGDIADSEDITQIPADDSDNPNA